MLREFIEAEIESLQDKLSSMRAIQKELSNDEDIADLTKLRYLIETCIEQLYMMLGKEVYDKGE